MIPLPEVVVTAPREHQKYRDDEKIEAGGVWEDRGCLSPSAGAVMSPYTLGKYRGRTSGKPRALLALGVPHT